MSKHRTRTRAPVNAPRAFTLIELMTVISIVALLAAILAPVVVRSKRSALRSACQSHLFQIGAAFHLYTADWDDRYPWAIDAFMRANSEAISDYPPMDQIPDMVTTLSAYTGGHGQVWRCPSDSGPFDAPLFAQKETKTYPSAYDFAGTSYAFYTTRYFGKSASSLDTVQLQICADARRWHCDYPQPNIHTKILNVLFGDGHVRFVSMMDQW